MITNTHKVVKRAINIRKTLGSLPAAKYMLNRHMPVRLVHLVCWSEEGSRL